MAGPPSSRPGWFAVPAPVRELFKLFPLATLPPEALPERSPEASSSSSSSSSSSRDRPRLYVFARSWEDAANGRPSFNPQCLKWQTFLRIAGVDVDLVPSNNHASPSGALPFLLPPTTTPTASTSEKDSESTKPAAPTSNKTTTTTSTIPLTGAKIHRYAQDHSTADLSPAAPASRTEAYEALLSQSLRPAWLYSLYLDPSNTPLLKSLYLPPSRILHLPALHALRDAATAEILKTTRSPAPAGISPPQLLADAADALRALSTLLADDEWFFGRPDPGLFDAEVFAYTWLVLDDGFGWASEAEAEGEGGHLNYHHHHPLGECLAGFDNLVSHRRRLYERCWA
ncbi:hypothetical protein BBK36DRAFT_1112905 [Trichoderma citrinoviride]|uniref:Mitochondrial outer membrane transport complex Sam37/metaxin N-terminal domain-containing protein n=1 Tax=Trichoderma citrinoviride TaxID=58853 RepID=A0A2T4BH97_9HYPO|nr:hypothetical protein BBK36DRAFT_1112905 [Trichoderma citrinoviride]PTB68693.1 hypothetical protein BBK36DRAFT_1112905 [Trichoderma citrinoviride]